MTKLQNARPVCKNCENAHLQRLRKWKPHKYVLYFGFRNPILLRLISRSTQGQNTFQRKQLSLFCSLVSIKTSPCSYNRLHSINHINHIFSLHLWTLLAHCAGFWPGQSQNCSCHEEGETGAVWAHLSCYSIPLHIMPGLRRKGFLAQTQRVHPSWLTVLGWCCIESVGEGFLLVSHSLFAHVSVSFLLLFVYLSSCCFQ